MRRPREHDASVDSIERASAARSVLVATDLDGTIAGITAEPRDVLIEPDASAALVRLGALGGVTIAVVSGRTADDLAARTAALGPIWRVSEHGACVEQPDGTLLECSSSAAAPADWGRALDALERRARALAARWSGVRVERKVRGVAVHFREVEPAAREALARELERWRGEASDLGLCLLAGRLVLEARTPGHDKAAALAAILARLPPGTVPVYGGDDTTDEGAIALARERGGIGVYVRSPERPEPAVAADIVDGPAEWIALLARLAAARATGAAS